MDYNNLCPKCFKESASFRSICPYCGFSLEYYTIQPNCLPIPSVLNGRYITGVPLGIGGFGITYIAFDTGVGGVCAVKEYMPDTVSFRNGSESEVSVSGSKKDVFDYGMIRFMQEAELLKNFSKSPDIINVFDSFYENGTAYYIMEYLDGKDLKSYTNNFKHRLEFDFGYKIFIRVMNGLERLHDNGVIHRDISPDNIYITKNNMVKILDFGSARYALTQRDRNLSVIVKMGYAPGEQYSTKLVQGAYTDIYALGATFYHLFSGNPPPEATERLLDDTLKPLCRINLTIPQHFSDCLEKMMAVKKEERYQSVSDLRLDLEYNVPEAQEESMSNDTVREYGRLPVPEVLQTDSRTPVAIVDKQEIEVKPVPEDVYSAKNMKKTGSGNILPLRIFANIIDGILFMSLYFLLINIMMNVICNIGMTAMVQNNVFILMLIVSPFINILVCSFFEASGMRGTLGKMICGIIAVGQNGMRLDSRTALKRNFIKLLGIFLVMTEKNGEYLHNRLTSSKVTFRRGV